MSRRLTAKFYFANDKRKRNVLMTNESANTPRNETHTWLEPGAWRKPCIVHVTMVANARQALFGKLTHNGSEAVIEKTPIGWALINQQRRLLELCPEIKILADKVMPDHHHMVLQVQRTMSRSIRQVVRGYMQGCKEEARKLGFTETEETLRRKAEAKHYSYSPIPVESQRYRFVALNEIGRLLVER